MGGIADGEIERYDPLPPELVGRLMLDSHSTWTKSAHPPDPRVGQGEGGTVGCVDGRSGDLMLSPAHPRVTLRERERNRRTRGWAVGDRRKTRGRKIGEFGDFGHFKIGKFGGFKFGGFGFRGFKFGGLGPRLVIRTRAVSF